MDDTVRKNIESIDNLTLVGKIRFLYLDFFTRL